MFRRAVVVALAALALPAAAGAQATDCDRLAGYPFAPRVPGAGGAHNVLDPAAAVAACESEAAVHGDDPYVRLQLGRAYLGADQADTRVAELYASIGDALPAMERVRTGTLYDHGWAGLPQDLPKALELYEAACAMTGQVGALIGCNNAALVLLEGTDAAANARAISLLQTACSAGEAYACENLGYEYERGVAVPGDLPRATALYRQACDTGSPLGCSNLGNAMSNGYDGPVDLPGAVPLFRMACDAGEMMGCSNLGWALWQAWAGPADVDAAVPLFRRACDAEVPAGCENLGDTYYEGAGVPQNRAESARLYTIGCDGGRAWSCFRLGEQILAGDGIAANPALGRDLIRRGCEMGDGDACARADALQ